jgi:hypothetical protein
MCNGGLEFRALYPSMKKARANVGASTRLIGWQVMTAIPLR